MEYTEWEKEFEKIKIAGIEATNKRMQRFYTQYPELKYMPIFNMQKEIEQLLFFDVHTPEEIFGGTVPTGSRLWWVELLYRMRILMAEHERLVNLKRETSLQGGGYMKCRDNSLPLEQFTEERYYTARRICLGVHNSHSLPWRFWRSWNRLDRTHTRPRGTP